MATNLALDDRLIVEAQKLGGHKTKRDAVTAALTDYIRRYKRLGVLELEGTVDFRPDFDAKQFRRAKSDSASAPKKHRRASPRK